jgi:hypothetical protein
MTTETLLHNALLASGIGHFILCAGSLAIPRALSWNTHLNKLQPLLRQMFWTYAGYILVINFSFGIVSVLGTAELVDHSFLAKCITFFIGLYWLSRIIIQFLYFDRSNAPKGPLYSIGEVVLIALFVAFTIVYFVAFLYNNSWI